MKQKGLYLNFYFRYFSTMSKVKLLKLFLLLILLHSFWYFLRLRTFFWNCCIWWDLLGFPFKTLGWCKLENSDAISFQFWNFILVIVFDFSGSCSVNWFLYYFVLCLFPNLLYCIGFFKYACFVIFYTSIGNGILKMFPLHTKEVP